MFMTAVFGTEEEPKNRNLMTIIFTLGAFESGSRAVVVYQMPAILPPLPPFTPLNHLKWRENLIRSM
jgi:hypothetical protein